MFRIKTVLLLSFVCGIFIAPMSVWASSNDIIGAVQTKLGTLMQEARKASKDKATEANTETHRMSNTREVEVTDDELAHPETLTALDDLSPMVTLKEMRLVWGENGEKNPSIGDVELGVMTNYLIKPSTLETHKDYLKGGSKEGQKMPDTSETPATVRAQQKQYLISLMRGQALARTLMKRADKMDQTNKKLAETLKKRKSERELYQGIAIISTQTDYLMNNLIVVKAALAEIESLQNMQGAMQKDESGGGIVGSVLKAVF